MTLFCLHQGYAEDAQLWCVSQGDSKWTTDEKVSGAFITESPATAEFDNKLYCFYQGSRANEGKLLFNTYDGERNIWSDHDLVPHAKMSASPSAAVYRRRLYVAFQGGDHDGTLWSCSFDGKDWTMPEQVAHRGTGVGVSESPSLAEFNDQLYCAYQGRGQLGELWFTSWDGRGWVADQQVPNVRMSCSPLLVQFNKKLYCFHQGWGKNGELWWTTYTGGSWSNDVHVKDLRISASPGVAAGDGRIYILHQGGGNIGSLWQCTSSDGQTFTSDELVKSVGITGSPAVVVYSPK